jgi:hypothetical protein
MSREFHHMRVKFTSDGTREGTRLVDAETGELIEGVQSLYYSASANNCGFLSVSFVFPDVDVKVNDKTNGVVNFKRSYEDKKEELTGENGKTIPGISEVKIKADLDGVSMQLTQKETFDDLIRQAKEYREFWDRPKEHEIKNLKDLSASTGV